MTPHPLVLAVDDEAGILRLLKLELEAQGFRVITSLDGNEALKLAEEQRPDLMLLDILMPGINGRQLLGYLRKSGLRRFPIIVLSALRENDAILQTYLEGTDHYLTKPFELEELLNAIEYYLGAAIDRA